MLDALIAMVLISLTVTAFAAVNSAVGRSNRLHISHDIVDQYLIGEAQRVKALPWAAIANCGDEEGNGPSFVVYTPDSCPSNVAFVGVDQPDPVEVRGMTFDLYGTVTWADGDAAPDATPASYGTKVIYLFAVWRAEPGGRVRTTDLTVYRRPTISEAVPTDIPGSDL